MLKVGLTGGIGSGKSTVTRLLASYGGPGEVAVVDADVIAREVVAPGSPGLAAVIDAFGSAVAPGGVLDREALGSIVFADPDRRAVLSGILHPLIGARSAELLTEAEESGARLLIHDVPLLVENHLEAMYDEVLVVDVPLEVQLDRLVRLRGMDEQEARNRISSQVDRETRCASATVVLDNSGSPADLEQQVRLLAARWLAEAPTH